MMVLSPSVHVYSLEETALGEARVVESRVSLNLTLRFTGNCGMMVLLIVVSLCALFIIGRGVRPSAC